MELFLRTIQGIVKFVYFFVYLILYMLPSKGTKRIPPIQNKLLITPLNELIDKMHDRKLKSEDLVKIYIARINKVERHINAVVKSRFDEAIEEAIRADELMEKASKKSQKKLEELLFRYPLLGMPFTVKESCGVKGMSLAVGSKQRYDEISPDDGDAVGYLRAAGAIPLLVSATPEYCLSIETNTLTKGKSLNPYDERRTSGGSSGGEGALNGAGASLFGIGSDIAGSIRIPSLFNGVFGHKPTGGLVSVKGHFPYSSDPNYKNLLQIGPITRYSADLCVIMHTLAGPNSHRLNLLPTPDINKMKIYYSFGFEGINGLLHPHITLDIQYAIAKAVRYFKEVLKIQTTRTNFEGFRNSTEIALSTIVRLEDFPYLMNSSGGNNVWKTLKEYSKSLIGMSQYTKDGLIFELMRRANSFMPKQNLEKYKLEAQALKAEIVSLLGDDGVFLFPTFHVPAIHHNSSHLPLWGIDYSLIWNVLGLPATHVPMGFDDKGLPVGFQVVAAPFMDKLCFITAMHLELNIEECGWTPPVPNKFH